VTVLSQAGLELWREVHGDRQGMLLVPGAADARIPPPGPNPYSSIDGKICIFSGNLYYHDSQPEANRTLSTKLNLLGRNLVGSGIRVGFQGIGDTSALDPQYVTVIGSRPYAESWNYLQHAGVGVVVSAGPFMHNNESTKIYHYLRVGLPVVSEQGFPNDYVVRESGLGFVVPSESMELMASKVIEACEREWDREAAIRYILENHTWDSRARTYQAALAECGIT
jgi:glycosyltransferase involved in cell wall biosynthesis